MADHGTAIEWTQAPGFKGETWNPVTGCDRVSPGCAHCYALDLAARLKGMGQKRYQRDGDPKTSGPGFGLTLHPDRLEEPLRWRKPRMVFVNSMSDLFHEEIPDEYICRVFDVIRSCTTASSKVWPKNHVFQILTKRPERMRDICLRLRFDGRSKHGRMFLADDPAKAEGGYALMGGLPGCEPLPNVWLGVSIENRRFVHRADLLRQTPAAIRFISAEPLLGPLIFNGHYELASAGRASVEPGTRPRHGCSEESRIPRWSDSYRGSELNLSGIDWLIVGGESGNGHRPIDPQWVRDLRDACWEVDNDRGDAIAFFFKQWGGRTPKAAGRALDGRTWDEWPTALEAVPA